MADKKVHLACVECGHRNYATARSQTAVRTERLELRKFCKHCKKHTLHKEEK